MESTLLEGLSAVWDGIKPKSRRLASFQSVVSCFDCVLAIALIQIGYIAISDTTCFPLRYMGREIVYNSSDPNALTYDDLDGDPLINFSKLVYVSQQCGIEIRHRGLPYVCVTMAYLVVCIVIVLSNAHRLKRINRFQTIVQGQFDQKQWLGPSPINANKDYKRALIKEASVLFKQTMSTGSFYCLLYFGTLITFLVPFGGNTKSTTEFCTADFRGNNLPHMVWPFANHCDGTGYGSYAHQIHHEILYCRFSYDYMIMILHIALELMKLCLTYFIFLSMYRVWQYRNIYTERYMDEMKTKERLAATQSAAGDIQIVKYQEIPMAALPNRLRERLAASQQTSGGKKFTSKVNMKSGMINLSEFNAEGVRNQDQEGDEEEDLSI